jgi:hypothetical protein
LNCIHYGIYTKYILTLITAIVATAAITDKANGIGTGIFEDIVNYWEPPQFSMDEG